jgi:ferredoxin
VAFAVAAAPPRRAVAAEQSGKLDQSDQSFLVRAIRGHDACFATLSGDCFRCRLYSRSLATALPSALRSPQDDDQMKKGFVLTCVAYPTSDVTIKTHQARRCVCLGCHTRWQIGGLQHRCFCAIHAYR